MHMVDDDYLLLDYYYLIGWRYSCTKRVKRDYDYLDYLFLDSWGVLILSSLRLFGRCGIRKNRLRSLGHRSHVDYFFPCPRGAVGAQRWRNCGEKTKKSLIQVVIFASVAVLKQMPFASHQIISIPFSGRPSGSFSVVCETADYFYLFFFPPFLDV